MLDFLAAYWFIPVGLVVLILVYLKFFKKPKRNDRYYSEPVTEPVRPGPEKEKKDKKEKEEKDKKEKKIKR